MSADGYVQGLYPPDGRLRIKTCRGIISDKDLVYFILI